MKKTYAEKEIIELVRKLNECYRAECQWQSRRAQKEHVDLFDKKIYTGETYFNLGIGHYSRDLKLSYISMQRFLYATFAPQPSWEKQAEKQIEDKMQETRRIVDQLRP